MALAVLCLGLVYVVPAQSDHQLAGLGLGEARHTVGCGQDMATTEGGKGSGDFTRQKSRLSPDPLPLFTQVIRS